MRQNPGHHFSLRFRALRAAVVETHAHRTGLNGVALKSVFTRTVFARSLLTRSLFTLG
jgi:hypothetical protein